MNINQIIINLGKTLENAQAVSEAFCELSEACTPDEWKILHSSPKVSALLTSCEELNDHLAEADE